MARSKTSLHTRNDLLLKIEGLEQWGACEYVLRRAIERHLGSPRWAMHSILACTHLTCALYRHRGLSVSDQSLCPSYDLLRHGRPMDFALLQEARQTRTLLTRYYASGKPISLDQLDPWLRAMVVLANTIGTYEADSVGEPTSPWRDDDQALLRQERAPFDSSITAFRLPPGPLDALRSEIKTNLAQLPPLLSVIASMNALRDHHALYPNGLALAEQVLLPGLISLAFQLPAMGLHSQIDSEELFTIERLRVSAETRADAFDRTEQAYTKICASSGTRRKGSFLGRVVAEVLTCPLFTCGEIANKLRCSVRTIEKSVVDLEACGQISVMQRSGRLVFWSMR